MNSAGSPKPMFQPHLVAAHGTSSEPSVAPVLMPM
jgi:hypothetical protein